MITRESVNIMQRHMLARFNRIDELFAAHIKNFNDCLKDLSVSEVHIYFNQFGFLIQWAKGTLASADVLRSLEAMNFDQTCENKLFREMKRLKVSHKDVMIHQVIHTHTEDIRKEVKPLLQSYLEALKKFFTKLVEFEQSQPPVLYAKFKFIKEKTQKNDIFTMEMSLDQSVKFINDMKLLRGYHYTVNDHMIMFEQRIDQDKYIHWFMTDKKIIDYMKHQLKIYLSKEFGIKEKWIDDVSTQLGVKV